VDIYASIRGRIRLNIVDAVIAMEGDGPTTGDPVELGLIIVGEDAAAVDLIASSVISWDPMDVGTVLIAAERGLGPSSLEEVEIVGEPIEAVRRRLRKPQTQMDGQAFIDIRMPLVCSGDKCTGCGICATVCPGKAITVEVTPQIDDGRCIQCFCCVELCTRGALRAIRPPD
jgi:ferredoxin